MCAAWLLFAGTVSQAAIEAAPPRGEGAGPFQRLILQNVVVINGTGAPAFGPVDLVVEGDRIAALRSPDARQTVSTDSEVRDLSGHYVLPGLIDLHGHIGGDEQGVPAEYVYKLWLAHGITAVRDPGCGNGIDWCVSEQKRSAANQITAPRIYPYVFFGQGREQPMTTPKQAREWVAEMQQRGAVGMKCFGYRPDVLQAAFDELGKRGMGIACHHAQLDVARVNALTTARWGLTTLEHWYGLPEALFDDRQVQAYPADYNYYDEQQRFTEAGRLWAQAAERGTERYEAVIKELLERGVTLDPTFNIYAASRDVMRERQAEWHQRYTLPQLWAFFKPSKISHGSYFFDWGLEQELAWRDNYRRWMAFVDDYKNRGGRVTVGSDSGYIYKVYGFGTIHELEMLREAGFHPLEVIRAATLHGAEALGAQTEIGSIEIGKKADLLVIGENPLANLKLLYATGHPRLREDGEIERVGGVRYTIKDGIVYDAKALLADVEAMVTAAKRERGIEQLPQY
ncbi:amidohydrolase family protein [Pseudoxanthomonas sp. CAU 1598]|uniref:Amidohydrolase family protein n=1 Tax=Pseudomarimonas arenosa TaxID=2774145 RepID=A0AAW3ZQD7_9GAMM|nr:amidohydrolase family protein [Pseudomarimonas arenosa]